MMSLGSVWQFLLQLVGITVREQRYIQHISKMKIALHPKYLSEDKVLRIES